MQVRLADLGDAEGIRAIYNREVLDGTATFDLRPRSPEDQRQWHTDHTGLHAAVVAVEGPVVLGFGSLSPYRPRPAYRTTVEGSVYVGRDHQQKGVGKALLGTLVEVASDHGFHSMIGRISGHNEASIALHRACGFEVVGVEREVGRKFSRWLDVVVVQRLLG